MRVLLLQPTLTVFGQVNAAYSLTPPLGLAYVAAYLRAHRPSHTIEIIDCLIAEDHVHKFEDKTQFGLSDALITERIRQFQPDVVGIASMYTAFCHDVFRIAQLVKSVNPKIATVVGGSYSTEYHATVIHNDHIDFVVLGEGEETFMELVDALSGDREKSTVKSLAYKSGDASVITPLRPRIPDLDLIPFPARDLLNMKAYLDFTSLNGKGKAREFPATTIVTSRGCPMHCVYCSVRQVWGRKWTYFSAPRVVDEIEHLHREYGIREFQMLDDSMSVDKRRMEAICDELIKRQLDISWTTPNGIAHWTLTKPLLKKMRQAGCYRITFGIEVGDPKMREYIGKPFPLDDIKDLIDYANHIGMWTICTFILGFPNESKESMEATYQFAVRSGTDVAFFYALIPHPGAQVYTDYVQASRNDYLNPLLEKLSVQPLNNVELTSRLQKNLSVGGQINITHTEKEIEALVSRAQTAFMKKRVMQAVIHPWHYARKIRSMKDSRYFYEMFKLASKTAAHIALSKGKALTISRMHNKQILEK